MTITRYDPYAVFKIREYIYFTLARFTLTVAIRMQAVIVGWQIYQITNNVLSLGLIGLAEAIPFISVVLYAGHVVDIVERKKIIMLSTFFLILASSSLLFFSIDVSKTVSVYGTFPIYAVIFLTGIIRAFLGPSNFSFVTQIVPRELYANASTWNSTTWHVGDVVGPSMAGLVYLIFGDKESTNFIAYAIVVGLMIFSFLSMIFIKRKPLPKKEKKESLTESLMVGLKFVFRHKIVLPALSLDLFAVLFGGATALLPVFAKDILHVGGFGLGLLRAAPAMGAIVVALYLAYRPIKKKAGKRLLLSVAAFGVATILFALSANFYLSMFMLALTGAFDNVSVVVRHTILQLLTPENMRGRVSAVNMIFIGSSNEIGAFESGLAARIMTLVPSVIFGGAMTMLIAADMSYRAPELRNLNLDEIK